ncbi:MAG: hypothetical protein JSW58_05110 [Candidatus Latescibacterota bacterium]|nr:MAG: hypothetical protein JSW58_05110 [Candidatus Latescibacterota bacterium]
MRKLIAVVIVAGVHWLVTVGLMLAELDTGGLLGLFPTRGHDVVVGLLKVVEFPLLTVFYAVAPDGETLLLPVMILNSLLWGAVVYLGFRLVRRMGLAPVLVLMTVLAASGCGPSNDHGRDGRLSESQALKLAVELANEQCSRRFSETPFDSSSYSIDFRKGRWYWGNLDLAGAGGFSTVVSFDAYGNAPHVEVFFSTDIVIPADGPDIRQR